MKEVYESTLQVFESLLQYLGIGCLQPLMIRSAFESRQHQGGVVVSQTFPTGRIPRLANLQEVVVDKPSVSELQGQRLLLSLVGTESELEGFADLHT